MIRTAVLAVAALAIASSSCSKAEGGTQTAGTAAPVTTAGATQPAKHEADKPGVDGVKPTGTPIVHVETIDIADSRATIVPCVKIIRGIWNAGQKGATFEIEYAVTYSSRGAFVTKTFTVPLTTMRLLDHHHDPQDVHTETTFNVTDAPVDERSQITITAQIKHVDGSTRTEASEKHVSTHTPKVR